MKKLFLTLVLAFIGMIAFAQNISGTWNGELVAGIQKIPLVLNLTADGKCTLDSPQQGAKGIPANIDFLSTDSLKVSVSPLNASYAAHLENGELKGVFTQNGFKLPLNLKHGEPAKAIRPQTPQPPYPYETEEVTFTNDKAGATLAGTLTVPADAKCVLLMVTGSGAQNRDEEVFEHKPFAVIADRLARAGIATLRYDDRATGKSVGGMDANVTTKDFAEDAEAGIEWLRTSKRFKKVGILGHSEGGSIAFMLGAQKKVDFIVSLAGPAVKGDSVLLAQNKLLGGDAAKDLTIEKLREMPQIKQSPWIQWFIDYDPQGDIAKIKCPVMALNGSKDCQVVASQSVPALRRTLPKNKQNLIKQYDGLNHLFQHCQTGLPTEYGTIEETFSEEVIRDIITWVKQLK
jgi:dienelactone hydrolase